MRRNQIKPGVAIVGFERLPAQERVLFNINGGYGDLEFLRTAVALVLGEPKQTTDAQLFEFPALINGTAGVLCLYQREIKVLETLSEV